MTDIATPAGERSVAVARGGPRLFAGAADEPRGRRAHDAIVVVWATVALGATSALAVPPPAFARAVADLLARLPAFVVALGEMLSDLLTLVAVAVVVVALARRRAAVARDVLLAGALAVALWLLVGRSVEGSWPAVWGALRDAGPPPWYPSPRVAVPGAIVLTATPHLTMPFRRLARWTLGLGVFAVAVAGGTSALGAMGGLFIALIASSTVHLLFGSSAGRPSLTQVATALDELGVPIRSLGVADRQQAGFFHVSATDEHGDALVVKVYGRDAHDAALLSTLWRTVWYREAGAPLRVGRLQQVEHEAFMTLFAGEHDIVTDTVVMAGVTEGDDAVLVVRPRGTPLGELEPARALPAVWALVDQLQAAGITHGQLDHRHLTVAAPTGPDQAVALGLNDFRGAALGRDELRQRTDEAQALVTTALLAGPAAAVAAAAEALGAARLAAVLPVLQTASLTPLQRQALAALDDGDGAEDGWDLDDLRTAAAAAAGVEPPELRQLRRITVGSIVRVVLPAIAVVMLISALAGLDLGELVEQLVNATWWLVVAAFLLGQVPRLAQACSTLGAAPVPLPLGPVYALQLATSYVAIALPGTAARVAVNIRFFQRHGVPPGAAIAAGAVDGFSGFIVQIIALVSILLFSSMSLDIEWGSAAGSAGSLLLLVVVIAVAAAAVVLVVPKLRRFVIAWVRRLTGEAWSTLRGLRSPRRLALLFGGNLANEVLFALTLGVFTRAVGYPVELGELLLINISVALLAGLLPIPGGVGVAEGGLTLGLIRAGMPEEVAFGAVLMYRMATFYLPPIWGYFAMRWLERHDHL